MLTLFIVSLTLLGAAYIFDDSKPRIEFRPIRNFNLDRYLGRWYEIARFDHRFERGLDYVTAEYSLNDNGSIKVVNRGFDDRDGRLHETVGKAKTTSTPGLLRVSFFLFFYSDYNILALGDNYDWVLLGSSSTKYLWIMSRTPTLPEQRIEYIIDIARQYGYDTSKLIFVKQIPTTTIHEMQREREYAM